MEILNKSGKEVEVQQDWIDQWTSVYFKDDVLVELQKAKLWAWANPEKRKKNIRRFLTNWIMRSCRLKPQMRMVRPEPDQKPTVSKEFRSDALARMKELLK